MFYKSFNMYYYLLSYAVLQRLGLLGWINSLISFQGKNNQYLDIHICINTHSFFYFGNAFTKSVHLLSKSDPTKWHKMPAKWAYAKKELFDLLSEFKMDCDYFPWLATSKRIPRGLITWNGFVSPLSKGEAFLQQETFQDLIEVLQ